MKELKHDLLNKLYKAVIWCTAGIFIAIESQEIFELQQINQITIFALLFVISNYQLSTARYHLAAKDNMNERQAKQASFQMFTGSLLAALDAAMDQLIQDSAQQSNGLIAIPTTALFYLGWVINLIMALLVARSLSSFVDVMTTSKTSGNNANPLSESP